VYAESMIKNLDIFNNNSNKTHHLLKYSLIFYYKYPLQNFKTSEIQKNKKNSNQLISKPPSQDVQALNVTSSGHQRSPDTVR